MDPTEHESSTAIPAAAGTYDATRLLEPLELLSLVRRLHRAESAWARHTLGVSENESIALQVLLTAGADGRVLRQGELAAELEVSGASMSVLVDRLQHRGLVERLPHPDDRRSTAVRATAKAGAEVGGPAGALHDRLRDLVRRRDPQQREAFAGFLQELVDAMEVGGAKG
jgi:DNA-binding MarR family transcriptional regulator